MKLKTAILYLFTFAFLAMPSFAKNAKKKMTNSQKAKMILNKAINNLNEMKSFSATLISGHASDTGFITTIMQKKNSDGTFSLRTETKGKLKTSIINIFNNQGLWNIIDKTAIKMSFLGEIQKKQMENIIKISPLDGTYSFAKNKVNEIECFLVTVKLSNKDIKKQVAFLIKKLPKKVIIELKKKGEFDLSKNIPFITKYYIGQKNFFIYKTEEYNTIGTKISQKAYSNVKINIDLDERLFQIPEHLEVKVAKTLKDFSKIMLETLKKKHKTKRK